MKIEFEPMSPDQLRWIRLWNENRSKHKIIPAGRRWSDGYYVVRAADRQILGRLRNIDGKLVHTDPIIRRSRSKKLPMHEAIGYLQRRLGAKRDFRTKEWARIGAIE